MARATAAPPARAWTIEERARNIHKIRVDLDRVGDEFWCLLQSDVHWDNPKSQRDTFKRHLEMARERDALILDNGDFFCAMQGKFDKRANKSDLRPEHQRSDYLDALVDTAADYLAPYADLLGVRGLGNHETAILKRHETNLTERLVERLKVKGSKTVALGGYSGYVVFEVAIKTRVQSIKLHYHHGFGGGGPVTRGVIQTNRQAVYLADADIVLSGHTHDAWQVPIQRVRLNADTTKVEHIRQLHVRVPGYKEEYGDGASGWHIERGGPPKPIGAAWLHIRYDRTGPTASGGRETILEWDVTEAR
jgi:hypothetical protein